MVSLLHLLSVFCILRVSLAQLGATDFGSEEVVQVGPSVDVETTALFPRYPNNALPLGQPIEVLFGFKNNGQHTFNVTIFYGSLLTDDSSTYLQNFTSRRQNQIVRTGESWTFSYWFMPDALLEPKDYFFLGAVEYKDEDSTNYTSSWFNSTVHLTEDSSSLELQSVFSSVFGLGVFGLAGYVVFTTANGSSKPSKTKTKKETSKGTSDDEWGTQSTKNWEIGRASCRERV